MDLGRVFIHIYSSTSARVALVENWYGVRGVDRIGCTRNQEQTRPGLCRWLTLHLMVESFQKNTNHGGQLAWQTEEERYYNADIGGITLVRNRKEATMMIQQ